ncbi:hypothetical protein QK916_12850 [Lactococcus lactis]|uniref:hypothetical protein n=1 Tax=Lactococcus lactis TaxID=1358 RepID=UPI00325F64AA
MKNTFKQELYYMFHSKLIVIFLSITTLLVFLGALQAINLQKSSVVQFEQTKSIYKNKTDFLKDLRKNYTESNITDEETNINTEINNSARYSYDYVQKSNYQLTSTGFPLFIMKYLGLIFLPLVMGILGILLSTTDYKYGTYKRRLSTNSWKEIIVGKILGLSNVILGLYFYILILSMVVGVILPNFAQYIDLKQYNIESITPSFSSGFTLILCVLVLVLITGILSFLISLSIKSLFVSLIGFLVYYLAIPNLGKYDYKNVVMNIFSTASKEVLGQPIPYIPLDIKVSIILVIIYVALVSTGALIIFNKYTKYSM